MCGKKASWQTRPVSTLQLLVSFPTVICALCTFTPKRFSVVRGSKMGLRKKASFCLCADNSFIVSWWPMTRLIPGMYKRFQIKADGRCYSHPIWPHHPLSGRYNPSLIWYKNLPVVKIKQRLTMKTWTILGQIMICKTVVICSRNLPDYFIKRLRVKSAYEPSGPSVPELIPVSVAWRRLGIFLLSPGWDASPSAGLTPALTSPVPIYTPGRREALWEWSVLPKNTTQRSQSFFLAWLDQKISKESLYYDHILMVWFTDCSHCGVMKLIDF